MTKTELRRTKGEFGYTRAFIQLRVIRSAPYVKTENFPRVHIVKQGTLYLYPDGGYSHLGILTWCDQVKFPGFGQCKRRRGKRTVKLFSHIDEESYKNRCPYCWCRLKDSLIKK